MLVKQIPKVEQLREINYLIENKTSLRFTNFLKFIFTLIDVQLNFFYCF